MKRMVLGALIALPAILAVAPSLAEDWPPRATAVGSFYAPAPVWPLTPHDPAISKTLRPHHKGQAAPAPYDPSWQNQTVPAPQTALPRRFSIPQQGYYPREGEIQQAPGYEYDFSGPATFPPTYPMEGAAWRGPRSSPAAIYPTAIKWDRHGTYAECPG